MQIIILIVGIMLGVYGHSWMNEKFPNTRPEYCSTNVFQNGEKPKDSIGKKLDKVLDVINE